MADHGQPQPGEPAGALFRAPSTDVAVNIEERDQDASGRESARKRAQLPLQSKDADDAALPTDEAPAAAAPAKRECFNLLPPGMTHKLLLRGFPGAKIPETLACILAGVILYAAVPRPEALTQQAWGLLAIFVATILGLILEPLPNAPVALAGVVVALWTGTMTYKQAFSAFGNDTIWLIMAAFFFAKGVEVTGLGARIADICIWGLGHSSLGLAYALALAELILALCMPSTTARAAGVFVPIITSLSRSFDSFPNDPSRKRLGEFLFLSQAQVSSATSCMFYLGGAQTPVAINLASEQGVVVPNPFDTYFRGAVMPSLVLIVLVPLAVYLIKPPQVKRTPWARQEARDRLRTRGRPQWREIIMMVTLVVAVALWCSSSHMPFKLANASVALLGVVFLVGTGAIKWDDLLAYRPAWELLIWLTILFSMCTNLTDLGVIKWISESISGPLIAKGYSKTALFWMLNYVFAIIHYGIASQTAHVTALVPPFLAIMLEAGFDGTLAALSLAYTTNLIGGLTHYASAQAAAYYAAGYYTTITNVLLGALICFTSMAIFMGIGMGWWRVVGLWPK